MQGMGMKRGLGMEKEKVMGLETWGKVEGET